MSEEAANQHYLEAMKLFGEGKNKEAVEAYGRALEEKPDWTDAMHGMAMAYSNGGLHEKAIEVARRILELDPNDPFTHTSLSMFFQRKGDIEEAEKEGAKARMLSWKEELKKNPDAPPPGPAGSMDVIQ